MKTQLLTSFDIHFLAAELADLLAGKAIKAILCKSSDYYIIFDNITLQFIVFRGSPFLITCQNPPPAKNRLNIIKGGLVTAISQVHSDRIVRFDITIFDKLGKRKNYHLYFELFKNGNIVLTDNSEKIMFSVRKSHSSGDIYVVEGNPGFNILNHDISRELMDSDIEQIRALKIFQHSDMLTEYSNAEINAFVDKCLNDPKPSLIFDMNDKPMGYAVYNYLLLNNLKFKPCDSLLQAVTEYIDMLSGDKAPKTFDYKKLIKKAESKLAAIENELAETESYKKYRLYGELLLANLHNIEKGQKVFQTKNPSSANGMEIVSIELNPSLSPDKNAEQYFDKARKLEKSIPIIEKRFAKQRDELDRLRKLDSGEIEDEYSAATTTVSGKQRKTKLPFKQYDLGGGWIAYAGKSAKSNDQLTFGFARKDDLWFHAWQTHGSHVILRAPHKGQSADHNLLLKAASLAAYLSKARTSGKVPVIYTEVRYLRKVKKVPGKAIYTNEKELMVEPISPRKL